MKKRKKRLPKPHKHQWRKVGGTWDGQKMVNTKKRCIVPGCTAEKEG